MAKTAASWNGTMHKEIVNWYISANTWLDNFDLNYSIISMTTYIVGVFVLLSLLPFYIAIGLIFLAVFFRLGYILCLLVFLEIKNKEEKENDH